MRAAPKTTWRSLFSPAESRPYWAAINAVGEDLARRQATSRPTDARNSEQDEGRRPAAAGLYTGKAGPALFFAYRHLATGQTQDKDLAVRLLNEAITDVVATPFTANFFDGWTGVAWAASHLCTLPGWHVEEDPVSAVDGLVNPLVRPAAWTGSYDLATGLAGLGVYALERLPRPAAAVCLSGVVDSLAARAQEVDGSVTWLTPPEHLDPREARQMPDGVFDLGMAHGVPGVIALLAEADAAGVERARPLLDGAVNWLLDQAPLPGPSPLFPHGRAPGVADARASRLGWCYGAPGMAAALMVAAHRTGQRSWRTAAVDLAVSAAATPLDLCRIEDHGLCHGAAGVAHLYNRMYQATGHEGLREGARTWFKRLLDMRHPRGGVGGFLAYQPRAGQGDPWVADGGLLNGAAGTGLALLTAVSDVEPRWDRMMLASVPPADMD
jgi:lantibiotic modifying enzyme